MKKHFLKEDIETADKHLKTCSTSLSIREMQIKTTMRYYYVSTRKAKITNSDNRKTLGRIQRNWIIHTFLKEIKEDTNNGNTSMFMHWKTSYCYTVNTTESDLQIQHKPYQNPNDAFCRNGKIYPKIQGTQNSQKHIEMDKAERHNSQLQK